jgi:DNA repair exonuclease SbcCD nuclease subunit
MLRFLHGGDFHLDSPFHALSPREAAAAREEQRALLSRFADLSREMEVSLVFLTGDLFDAKRIYPETLEALREALASIPAMVFLSPGNHDPYTDKSPYARLTWPANVHIFETEEVSAYPLPHLGCTVYGSAFTGPHRHSLPLEGFCAKDEGLRLGCFHGEVTQGPSRYGAISPSQIAASGLHYLALGHVHSASGLQRAGSCFYAYPGCPQGRGFDELGEKGVYLGCLDEGSITLDFLPLCQRQYRLLEVPLEGRSPEEALQAALPPVPSGDIVRLLFTGEREEDEAFPETVLHNLAAPYFYHVTIEDETELRSDLWARKREEGLLGAFLREMHRRMEAAPPEERHRLALATRYGLAALEGREAPL